MRPFQFLRRLPVGVALTVAAELPAAEANRRGKPAGAENVKRPEPQETPLPKDAPVRFKTLFALEAAAWHWRLAGTGHFSIDKAIASRLRRGEKTP